MQTGGLKMKGISYLLFSLAIICLLSCQKEKTEEVKTTETEEVSQAAEEKTAGEFALPELDNDYLVSVYEMQEFIKMEQENIELRKKYCQNSYLKDHGVFVSMGIAQRYNPKDGSDIPTHLSERAAKLDAMRWALYGEQWLKNDYQPPFGKIAGTITYPTQVINKAFVGDSLFIFLATKMP